MYSAVIIAISIIKHNSLKIHYVPIQKSLHASLTVRHHTEADVVTILVADLVKRCLHSICQELRHSGLVEDTYPNRASYDICMHGIKGIIS